MTEETASSKISKTGWAVLIAVVVMTVGILYLTATQTKRDNMAAVRTLLRDPYSAEFSHVFTLGKKTCGVVNSKNLLGAYTGAELFFVDDGIARIGDEAMELSRTNPDVCTTDAFIAATQSLLNRSGYR